MSLASSSKFNYQLKDTSNACSRLIKNIHELQSSIDKTIFYVIGPCLVL
jgi:hypothetical protein